MRRYAFWGWALSFGLLALSGCKRRPAEGQSCTGLFDNVVCADPQLQLSCERGEWRATACLGPKGCQGLGSDVECDTSLGAEGAPCGSRSDAACSIDHKAMLQCSSGRWALTERCLGADGCTLSGATVLCDSTVAREGERCRKDPKATEAEYACSEDHKAVLTCKDSTYAKVEACSGAKGCTVGKLVECDGPTASEGDYCVSGSKEDFACSPDKKARLQCKDGSWKVELRCLGEQGCRSSGLDVMCDDSVSDPGTPCEKEDEDAAVCSTDGKTILVCRKGTLVKDRVCPRACKVGAAHIECQ